MNEMILLKLGEVVLKGLNRRSFDVDAQLRLVDIHLQVGVGVVEQAPHVLGDLHAVLSGGIDSPVSSYMIAKRGVQLELVHFFSPPYTSQVVSGAVVDGVLVLGAGQGPGDGNHAEHLPAGGVGPVYIARLLLGLHIDGALLGVDAEAAVVLEPAADIGRQLVLKDFVDEHITTFDELDEDEQLFCRLASNLISALIFLIPSLIGGGL